MALDLTALTPYVNEQTELAARVILTANTVKDDLVSFEWGVFGDSMKLNNVSSTPIGSNASCYTTSAGTTTLTQGSVKICPITFNDDICLDDFKKYWTSVEQSTAYLNESPGSNVRQVITENRMRTIALELDKILWRGDITLTGNLSLCDGFLKVATALTGEITLTRAAMTSSNSVAYVNSILALIPENILDKAELYLSPADFQSYLSDLTQNYKYNNVLMSTEMVHSVHHPGSIGLTVHSVAGMTGVPSGTFLATTKENIVAVFGDRTEMYYNEWYSFDQDLYKSKSKTRMGVGFRFAEYVVRSNG